MGEVTSSPLVKLGWLWGVAGLLLHPEVKGEGRKSRQGANTSLRRIYLERKGSEKVATRRGRQGEEDVCGRKGLRKGINMLIFPR